MNGPKAFLVAAICVSSLVYGCGPQDRQYEHHSGSLADLSLNSANHPHGYEKSECFVCHVPANLHQVNRLGSPNFDLARTLVQESGLQSCSGCHGQNGVSP